jgi:hypothetical protein
MRDCFMRKECVSFVWECLLYLQDEEPSNKVPIVLTGICVTSESAIATRRCEGAR